MNVKQPQWTLARGMLATVITLSQLSAQGLHIHDAVKAAAAKDAKDAFDEASNGDQDAFTVMISNVRSLERKTLDELYLLNQQVVRSRATQMPAWRWGRLTCDLHQREQEFLAAYKTATLLQGADLANIKNAKGAIAAAADKLQATQDALDKRTQELSSKAPEVKTLRDAIDNVRSGISAQTKVPKNLKDLTQFQSLLQKDWSGLKGVHDWLVQVAENPGGAGLQLSMLDLENNLQSGEVDRLQLQIDRLTAEVAYSQRVLDLLSMVVFDGTTGKDDDIDTTTEILSGGTISYMYAAFKPQLLPTPLKGFCDAAKFNASEDRSPVVIETLGVWAKVAQTEVGVNPEKTLALKNLISALSMDIAIVGYQKYLLMEAMLEHATDELINSIQNDALNARMRATLISHGLDGLNTYHQGGITGADVANVISAAQTIATAVIAGKLK